MADTISNLPEEILCHILSFLPTKQAVVTSVLSKRWKSLWRILPTIDFDDANYVQSQKKIYAGYCEEVENYVKRKKIYAGFVRSVSAVLLRRDSYQSIQKFSLKCSSFEFYNPTYVFEWIHTAIQSRVEHLDLSLPPPDWNRRRSLSLLRDINILPWYWYWRNDPITPMVNCSTLMVLNLENLVLQPSSTPHFPSLKILHMKVVGISDDSEFSKFISGCPILENLILETILLKGPMGGVLSLFSPINFGIINFGIINCSTLVVLKLKELWIEVSSSPNFPSLKILHMENLKFYDLVSLSKFLSGCPNLEELKTIGGGIIVRDMHRKVEIEILPKLVRASIRKDHVFLLKAVTNAKFLRIY